MTTHCPSSRPIAIFLALLLSALSLPAQLPDWTGQPGSAVVPNTFWRRGFFQQADFSVVNQGASYGSAPGSHIRYELRSQSGVSVPLRWKHSPTGAPQSGHRSVVIPGLTNSPSEITAYLETPETLSNGTYTLRVLVDSQDQFSESNESNNWFVMNSNITVIPTPDLAFSGRPTVTGSNVIRDAGEIFTIGFGLLNVGDTVSIPGFLAAYYLVPDGPSVPLAVNPNNAIFLGYRAVPAFPAGAQVTGSPLIVGESFNLPVDLDLLTYRVGVILDPLNSIEEYEGESNNKVSESGEDVTVRYVLERPDYEYGGVSFSGVSPLSTPAGQNVTFSGRVINSTGFTNPNITTIQHYLVKYQGGAEYYLGQSLMPSILANGAYDFGVNLQVPAYLVSGEYFYRFEIDAAGLVPERDETNNSGYHFDPRLVVTAPVLPDLVINGGQFAPGAVAPGDTVAMQAMIENDGYSGSGSFGVRFVLSEDTTIGNGDDRILGTPTSASIGAGVSATFSPTVTVPPSTPFGQYWVGIILDPANQRAEISESNNSLRIVSSRLTVSPDGNPLLPDLRPTTATPSIGKADFGEEVTLTLRVRNDGTADASGVTCHAFLTLDNTTDTSQALPLGSVNLGAISHGTQKSGTLVITVPKEDVPVGTYRIIMVADQGNAVVESNETNNRVNSGALIQLLPADENLWPALIAAQQSASPSSVLAGQMIETLVRVGNEGGSPAGGVVTRMVLSSDASIGNGDDIVLREFGPDLIAVGGHGELYEATVRLPDTLAPGSYRIGWIVDPDRLVPVQSGSTGTVSVPLTVRERRFHLVFVERDGGRHFLELHETDPKKSYHVRSGLDLVDWKDSDSQEGNADGPLFFEIDVDPGDAAERYFHQGVEE